MIWIVGLICLIVGFGCGWLYGLRGSELLVQLETPLPELTPLITSSGRYVVETEDGERFAGDAAGASAHIATCRSEGLHGVLLLDGKKAKEF